MADTPNGRPATFAMLANPIVFIAVLMVLSVIVLIGSAVVGVDKVVLSGMARSEFARGLITYLFAVVTIGTAVVLVLAALLSTGDDVSEKRFQHGKEILSLLLGLFGTMVGFYFGAETAKTPKEEAAVLRMSSPDVSPQVSEVGGRITVRAVVSGGTPPYRFGIGFSLDDLQPQDPVSATGWIVKEVPVPPKGRAGDMLVVRVVVIDASARRIDQASQVQLKP
jgi:hypothetical protein